jgi:condensin complex subunit 1
MTLYWNRFCFAEQAINTIYQLAEHPDILCSYVIKKLAARTFHLNNSGSDVMDMMTDSFQTSLNLNINGNLPPSVAAAAEPDNLRTDNDTSMDILADLVVPSSLTDQVDSIELSQLCFVVGHVAMKQIAHIEAIEMEWKRRRSESGPSKAPGKALADELDQVAGSAEDEFAEAVQYIRERELLYGSKSLLTRFGPIIEMICRSNVTFTVSLKGLLWRILCFAHIIQSVTASPSHGCFDFLQVYVC